LPELQIGDPCWRFDGLPYLAPPKRIRLADGSTRTDPEQFSDDQELLTQSGWERSELTESDIVALTPPAPPPPPEPGPLEAGYDTGLGFRLAWQPEDVALLTGLYVLGQRAEELGVTQPLVVTDTDGQPHSLTFSELDQMMLGYGSARAALSAPPPGNVTL